MNILDYYSKISSTDMKERAGRMPEESVIFELRNGSFTVDNIVSIDINNQNIRVDFSNQDLSIYANARFNNKVVQGVTNTPYYTIQTTREKNSINIKLTEI